MRKNLVLVLKSGALIMSDKFINFVYLGEKVRTISMVFLTTLYTGVLNRG